MLTFLRRARIIDDTFCAISIRSSRSLSISDGSETGNFARCTEFFSSSFLRRLRSVYIWSVKNGAIGAASTETVSRHVKSVWYAESLSSSRPPPQYLLRLSLTYQFDRFSVTNSDIAL